MIGSDYPTVPFRICDNTDEQQRIDVLQDMAAHGSRTPKIADLARVVRGQVGRDTSARRIASEALLAIQCLEYHPHPQGEWFQPAQYTLKNGGNCEDLSVALAALLLAMGIPARVAWITQDNRPLNHVAVRLENGLWADPSIWGALLGEETYDAIDRVQIEGVTSPADLVFRASKEYPMSKRVKMRAAVRPAGDGFVPPVIPGLGGSGGGGGGLPPTDFQFDPRLVKRNIPLPYQQGTPNPNPPAPPVLAILVPAPSTSARSVPTASGTAPPGVQVAVALDGGTLPNGVVTSGADGSWSVTLPTTLGPGTHGLTATVGTTAVGVQFTIEGATGGTDSHIDSTTESGNGIWWALGIAAVLGVGYMAMKKGK